MIFRTIIENLFFSQKIKLKDNLFFIGSCFSDNIGKKLSNVGLNCTINPYGTTYNPLSVCKVLENIYKNNNISSKEIIEQNGVFNSLLHHSFIYGNSEQELINKIDNNNYYHNKTLNNSNFIFITLGTSWVYEYIKTKEIVNNCHKLPSSSFKRYSLSVENIVKAFDNLFDNCEKLKDKKIIFTVSPIRHTKDGLIENSLSKATLRVAIDILCKKYDNIEYFPAYEIVTDDLRDYRFYNEDMTHPSDVAVNYIFEIFKNSLIDKSLENYMNRYYKIHKALSHKAINENSEEYIRFKEQTKNRAKQLFTEYPQSQKLKELFNF